MEKKHLALPHDYDPPLTMKMENESIPYETHDGEFEDCLRPQCVKLREGDD